MKNKDWYKSKTLWIAVAQGVVGVLTVLLSENPELKAVGIIASTKGVLDLILRLNTDSRLI